MFKSQKLEEYDEDEKLVQTLREIPGIKKFEFKISFGGELISKFTVEEKMVVLAHEIGHVLKKHMLLQSFLFFLVLIGLFFLSFCSITLLPSSCS